MDEKQPVNNEEPVEEGQPQEKEEEQEEEEQEEEEQEEEEEEQEEDEEEAETNDPSVSPMNKFKDVINDFHNDINKTFPEYNVKSDLTEKEYRDLFEYCKNIYPKHFFNILYMNEDIFDKEELFFLPNINFGTMWKKNISEKTKEVIWKYLQIILFICVNDVDSKKLFGESADMFKAIDEEQFKSKLEETISNMGNIFDSDVSQNMPSAEDMHEHINDLMEGKIGSLAKEIAEETANDFKKDMNGVKDMDDVFKSLLKNPQKMMKIVKSISTKLESKFKSGEMKESELLEEASEILKKMKKMPGMKNMDEMFKNMGMPGVPKGKGKIDLNAIQNNLSANLKNAKLKERLKKKLEDRKNNGKLVDNKFVTGEKIDKSYVSENVEESKPKKNKKKKKKKKKGN